DPGRDLIWILDTDPACVLFYQQTLGLLYEIRQFSSVEDFTEAFASCGAESPKLLISDPDNSRGSFAQAFERARMGSAPNLRFPDFIIASRMDDLDLMRFYLRAGARDYILKPLKPNELVAKVEKALLQISNREMLVLRNDLDGIHVGELTFR